jgi:type IV secretion system protein VirD4
MREKLPLILTCVASLILFVVFDIATSTLITGGITLASSAEEFNAAFSALAFSIDRFPIVMGIVGACIPWIIWAYCIEMFGGNFMPGIEHGSARWATKKEIESFKSPTFQNNLIFTRDAGLPVVKEGFDIERDRNLNVLVVGASGSGKTRYYVKPNAMQLNSNYFITDTKGTTVREVGHMFEKAGYDIAYFDTINPARSGHYNPFAYIKTELQILTFTECFIENTTGNPNETGDPFWPKAERCGITMHVSYLLNHCEKADCNMRGLITLMSLMDCRDDDKSYMSPLDMLYFELETGLRYVKLSEFSGEGDSVAERPFARGGESWGWVKVSEPVDVRDFALSTYREFKIAAEKTLKSILMSLNVRVKPLTVPAILDIMQDDDMHLNTLGSADTKSVIFCACSDSDSTYHFLFSLLMWQSLDVLYKQADELYGGKLPCPMNYILDEFANMGKIPSFTSMIATTRSRNIMMSILVQSVSQLESNYSKQEAETIINCCDTMLYLGGTSKETYQMVSDKLGKQTVRSKNVTVSKGSQPSTSTSYSYLERPLETPDEVGRLSRRDGVVMISGTYPYKGKKFDITEHPNYHLIDPGHKGARFSEPFDYMKYRAAKEREAYEVMAE